MGLHGKAVSGLLRSPVTTRQNQGCACASGWSSEVEASAITGPPLEVARAPFSKADDVTMAVPERSTG